MFIACHPWLLCGAHVGEPKSSHFARGAQVGGPKSSHFALGGHVGGHKSFLRFRAWCPSGWTQVCSHFAFGAQMGKRELGPWGKVVSTHMGAKRETRENLGPPTWAPHAKCEKPCVHPLGHQARNERKLVRGPISRVVPKWMDQRPKSWESRRRPKNCFVLVDFLNALLFFVLNCELKSNLCVFELTVFFSIFIWKADDCWFLFMNRFTFWMVLFVTQNHRNGYQVLKR